MYSIREKIKHLRNLLSPAHAEADLALLVKFSPTHQDLDVFKLSPTRYAEHILNALLDVANAEDIQKNRLPVSDLPNSDLPNSGKQDSDNIKQADVPDSNLPLDTADVEPATDKQESEADKQADKLELKEKELADKESKLEEKADELEEKELDLEYKESELEDKESELEDKESELEAKEKDLAENAQKKSSRKKTNTPTSAGATSKIETSK